MIVEINYTALHFDNHQGESGRPYKGRLLRDVDVSNTLGDIMQFAAEELDKEEAGTKYLIGDYSLINVVIDRSEGR